MTATAIGPDPTNDGAEAVRAAVPYTATVELEGSCAILFHRWSNEAVAEKAAAAKGSKIKKQDAVDTYVWRDEQDRICLPGQYVVGALTDPRNGAAKYRQDPRSPRKSALDLFRAGVVPLTELAPVISNGASAPATVWDYLDARRVTVQRQGVTRVRPAFLAGWRATVDLLVLTPEYIAPGLLQDTLADAGRLVGVADHRPTFGRFRIVRFTVG